MDSGGGAVIVLSAVPKAELTSSTERYKLMETQGDLVILSGFQSKTKRYEVRKELVGEGIGHGWEGDRT